MNFQEMCVCSDCPLNNSQRVSSYITNQDKVEVLVLGQSPGTQELILKRPFVGSSGKLINPVIERYSANVCFINSISCRPVDAATSRDRVPATQEIKCCRPRFVKEVCFIIEKYKPSLILAFGAIAKKEYQRVLEEHKEFASIPTHYLDHPAHILRNNHLQGRYLDQLHNAMKSAFNNNEIDNIVSTKFLDYNDLLYSVFTDDYKSSETIGVDIETGSVKDLHTDLRIGTCAVACNKNTYFFDYRNGDIRTCQPLREMLAYQSTQKIFANALYDVVALEYYGFDVTNYTDLLPLIFLLDNTFTKYDLEEIVLREEPQFGSYKSKFKSSLADGEFLNAPIEQLRVYNMMDSFTTKLIYDKKYVMLPVASKKIFDKITLRLIPVLVDMIKAGMKINVDLLDTYKDALTNRYSNLEKMFNDRYGITKIKSTPQIRKWLFKDLKLKSIKETENGDPSTDKDVLKIYAKTVPDAGYLYEARRVGNLLDYFMPSIRENLDKRGFIHPNYKHFGVNSFRLACVHKDSIINTNYGDITIERLHKENFNGVYVHTPYGIRKMVVAFPTRIVKQWLKISTDKYCMEITHDHKVLVDSYTSRFVAAGLLKCGDFIETIDGQRRILNIIEMSSCDTQFYDMTLDMEQSIDEPCFACNGIFVHNCVSPNLQGIPRDKTGIESLDKLPLRRLFMARYDDSYIVEFDYSQQEIRIVAELSGDKNMLDAFDKGKDIHKFVASLVFGKPEDKISDFERQVAKGCVFGAIFGVTARSLSNDLQIAEVAAQQYLNRFFAMFPLVKMYMNKCHAEVVRNKCIYTKIGRPRKFIIHQKNVEDSQREAFNHTVQSLAADITFLSLINVHKKLKEEGILGKFVDIIHTVHDSILVDVRETHLQYILDCIPQIMCDVPKKLGFKVEFKVDYKLGKCWGENKKIEEIIK